MNRRYSSGALALAASLALALPGMAMGAEDDTPAPAAEVNAAYDQAMSCMALYLIIGSQFDQGSEESETFRGLFAAWSEFTKRQYPVQFEQSGEQDIKTQTDRLVDEFNAMSKEQFDIAIDSHIDTCQGLEDAGQILHDG